MLAAQPSGDFIGTFSERLCKLLFVQTLFPHQGIQSIGDSKGQARLLPFFAWDLVKQFLQRDIGGSNNSFYE